MHIWQFILLSLQQAAASCGACHESMHACVVVPSSAWLYKCQVL